MARSGYGAVQADLMRTPEAEAVLRDMEVLYGRAAIREWDFVVTKDPETGMAKTFTRWHVQFGDHVQDFRDLEYTNFSLALDRVLEERAEAILDANFGVKGRVGTRNCQRAVTLDGRYRETDRYGCTTKPAVPSLNEVLRLHVLHHERLAPIQKAAESRIVGEMIRIHRTDEWRDRRIRALKDAAMKEVAQVMMKYKELSADFMDEAVQHGIVNMVMEA